ncbi:hypothetical protein ABKN59_001699 [Abortiporus biennis]
MVGLIIVNLYKREQGHSFFEEDMYDRKGMPDIWLHLKPALGIDPTEYHKPFTWRRKPKQRPTPGEYHMEISFGEKTQTSPRHTLGKLRVLPTELLFYIFDNFEKYLDVISLSLTNTILYEFGYNILQRRYLKKTADWEGDRVVSFSDCSSWHYLPENSFTEAELEDIVNDVNLVEWVEVPVERDAEEDFNDPPSLANRLERRWDSPYVYCLQNFKEVRSVRKREDYGPEFGCTRVIDDLKLHNATDYCLRKNIRQLLDPHFVFINECSKTTPYVICNLSKRVYIKIRDVYKFPLDGIGCDVLLLWSICWFRTENIEADEIGGIDTQ